MEFFGPELSHAIPEASLAAAPANAERLVSTRHSRSLS
jgi:hypothetical protein